MTDALAQVVSVASIVAMIGVIAGLVWLNRSPKT